MRRLALASSVLLSCFAVVCCGGGQTAPAAANGAPRTDGSAAKAAIAPSDAAPPPQRDGRIAPLATPVRYAITLDIDPTQPRFQGSATILVDVPSPTRHVVLHGRGMTVSRAVAHANGADIVATPALRLAHGGLVPEELVLNFASALPAGRATIELAYDAAFSDDLAGLYRVKEGDRWYAFTQFESTYARRAFPCFDEPSFKVPFDVAITTPRGMIAVANSPETARRDDGAKTRFDFAPTPPLPSYLVAFAVGDFDVRAGSATPVPIRLVTAKGKTALGDMALETTRGIVQKLGDYFGVKYPFAKLDIVAVPEFAAGAMENPGLITFREELLLQDPARAPISARRRQALVIAHELAHIWFGDLVTTKWWNDLWLNEGFATWMEAKAVDEFDPRFEARMDAVAATLDVMDTDALASARAVRQPVSTTNETNEAFDRITYAKGAAVLGMIEHWIGEASFQRGVRAYITANAWKNATANDLLGALDAASGRDVSGMAATFLDRSGVPNVAVRAQCAKESLHFDLTQTTWHALGNEPKGPRAPWRIPVCIHDAGAKRGECTDLAGETGSLDSHATGCPAWSYPNAGEAGYYRFSLPEKDLRAIARGRAELDVPSRIGFVSNVWAQVRSGDLAPPAMLDTLTAFDDETERHVVEQIATTLVQVDNELVDDASRDGFRAYAAARLAKQKARLGWSPKPNEDPSRALLRRPVLLTLGTVAEDAATLREAEALAKAWLRDPKSVDADAAPIALAIASRHAGPARIDELRAALKRATTPQDRITALTALGAFTDSKTLRQALDLILTDEVKRQDLRYVLRDLMEHRASSLVLFGWLKDHWDALHKKLPGALMQRVVEVARHACTAAEREEAASFFTPRVRDVEGAERPLAEALEQASACIELRAHAGSSMTARFAHKSAGTK